MFYRILVPLDGSLEAEAALEPAAALARAFGGNLRLVRVCPPPVSSDYIVDIHMHEAVTRREHARLDEYLERVRKRYSDHGLTVVTRLLEAGDPAQQILAEVKADPVDVIVLTSHGRSGLARVLLGSVAEHISRQAPCPVLIFRADSQSAAASPAEKG